MYKKIDWNAKWIFISLFFPSGYFYLASITAASNLQSQKKPPNWKIEADLWKPCQKATTNRMPR